MLLAGRAKDESLACEGIHGLELEKGSDFQQKKTSAHVCCFRSSVLSPGPFFAQALGWLATQSQKEGLGPSNKNPCFKPSAAIDRRTEANGETYVRPGSTLLRYVTLGYKDYETKS